MKYSTYYKNLGFDVSFSSGIPKNGLDSYYDVICFSTIFTFHFNEDIKTINYYTNKYKNSDIKVGGISATLMPDKFYEQSGIKPHIGLDMSIEDTPPDYKLFPDHLMKNVAEVFTSRGCKNGCAFCAVKKLEPVYMCNKNWKNSVSPDSTSIMIHDNNLTSLDIEHFKDVMDFLKETKLPVTFDNGFDCRLFNEKHLKYLFGINLQNNGLRFAFDNMSQDYHIQKTVQMCLDAGISKSKIMAYVLFNFKDTFDESMYRATELKNLGVRPYPQQYRPLNDIEMYANFFGKEWNRKLAGDFRFYWLMAGLYTKISWNDYIIGGGKNYYKNKNAIRGELELC
jgi:hypothetical protein